MTWMSDATRQHGIVRTTAPLPSGLTYKQIRGMRARGVIVPVFPGVDRLAGVELGTAGLTLAAATAARGAASHVSAARAWGLRGFTTARDVHVSVPEQRRVELDGITVHRRRGLTRADLVRLPSGLYVTSPEVTLIDIAFGSEWPAVVSAFHDAWRKGLVTPAKFEGVLRRLGGPGRAGTVAARALLGEAMASRRPARSGYELVLADAIVGAGLPRPELNHPVRRPTGSWAEIDLAWPLVRYGDEFDHSFTHASPAEWRADIVRSVDLGAEGWWIDRFCEVHVEQHLDDVVAFIGTRLEERLRGRPAA